MYIPEIRKVVRWLWVNHPEEGVIGVVVRYTVCVLEVEDLLVGAIRGLVAGPYKSKRMLRLKMVFLFPI